MITLILAIRSLEIGGAERQFIELVQNIDKSKFRVIVCTMYGGSQEDILRSISSIEYYNLQKKGRYDFYRFWVNYSRLLEKINPDIIYSFLGEMNIFSLLSKPKNTKLIWGFRASNMNLSEYGIVSKIIFWIQKKLSFKVDKIITNSQAAIQFHFNEGFYMDKSCAVFNGINTDVFYRDSSQRLLFRQKYNLNEGDIAIAIVARIDYIKGYPIFAKVSKKLTLQSQSIHFFSIGKGDNTIKKECEDILQGTNRFHWLGEQKNLENLYSGFDIVVSASLGEGFSNSIAEAMSCECACVVTDVGDSKFIVDDFGIVVNVNDEKSLYDGLETMCLKDYKVLGKKSRRRIIENFSIQRMIENTEKELLECVE